MPGVLLPALHTLTRLLLKHSGEFLILSSFLEEESRLREVDDLPSHTAGKDGVRILTSGQLNSKVHGHFSTSNCRVNL